MFRLVSVLYERMVLRSPVLVLTGLVLICALAGYHARDFSIDASADSLLIEGDQALRVYRDTADRFGGGDFLFVTFTPDDGLFSDTAITQIARLRDELLTLPLVESVTAIVDVPLVQGVGSRLSDIARNYRTLSDPQTDREAARAELLASPVYSDLIISADGRTTALQVNLRMDPEFTAAQKRRYELLDRRYDQGLTAEETRQLEEANARYAAQKRLHDAASHDNILAIRDIIAGYRQYGDLHLGGLSMIADDMISFIKRDLAVFGVGVLAFLVLMLSIIFRLPRWVLLPLASCAIAGLLMTGILGYAGWQVTVISSNFISLMLILTMSMNIHLVVRYRQLRRDDPELDQHDLVFTMARLMVWPCLYTALTTMIGFGSLVVSEIKPVIDFGWMMVLGLLVTFLVSFIFFPAVLILLDRTPGTGDEKDDTPFTGILAGFTDRHGVAILVLTLLLTVASVVGIGRLKVENSFVNYFSEETEIYQGLRLIDEQLGGTTPVEVILQFDPTEEYGEALDESFSELDELFGELAGDPADAWFTAYKTERIQRVHDYLEGLPAVGKVLSLASVMELAESLNDGESFDAFELAVIYKRIPDELRAALIDPYISIENDQARISARIHDTLPDLRRNALLGQIHEGLQAAGLSPDDYRITGLLVLYNNMLQSLFRSQILTLGVVMAGIALMLLVLFRSAMLAAIGIIPNILAAAVILGLMGLAGIPLDMMTITIAAITIGIAVDNSIHYVYRFREEFDNCQRDYVATMYYCHRNIGKAVFYTALTIIIGFSILFFSSFIPTIYFGLLTALAMLIALLAALTLLPRLILLLRPFG